MLWLFVIGSGWVLRCHQPYRVLTTSNSSPGIVSMSIIFTSVFYRMVIISGSPEFDFLKSVMVAPVSRATVFVGKTLGGMTNSLIQASILLAVGVAIGIPFTTVACSGSSRGPVDVIWSHLTRASPGSYIRPGRIPNDSYFVVFPLFFLSGALFPLDKLPAWLWYCPLQPCSHMCCRCLEEFDAWHWYVYI